MHNVICEQTLDPKPQTEHKQKQTQTGKLQIVLSDVYSQVIHYDKTQYKLYICISCVSMFSIFCMLFESDIESSRPNQSNFSLAVVLNVST